MRRQLPTTSQTTESADLITQDQARIIMRVRNIKPRYSAAFAKAGLQPAETHGCRQLFRRSDAVAARARLDEIEARELADRQGTLALPPSQQRLGSAFEIAQADSTAKTSPPSPPPHRPLFADEQPRPAPKPLATDVAVDTHRMIRQVFGMLGEAKHDVAASLKILTAAGTQPTAPNGVVSRQGRIVVEVHHYVHAAN